MSFNINTFFFGSIRKKIIIWISLVFLSVYSATMVYDYTTMRENLLQIAQEDARSTSLIIAGMVYRNYDHSEEDKEIQSYVQDTVTFKQEIAELTVIDKENIIIASSKENRIGSLAQGFEYHNAMQFNKLTMALQETKGVLFVRIIVPVRQVTGTEIVTLGLVELVSSLERPLQQIQENRNRIIILGLIILSAIILLVVFITARITFPIKLLYEGLEKVDKGDLSVQVKVVGHDEISFLGNSFNNMVQGIKKTNDTLSKFVPQDFLRFMGKSDINEVTLNDAIERDFTILFTDMRSFSTISEKISPKQLMAFVNEYLNRIAPIIRKHDGFIITYLGDAIMAAFPESADDALLCAVDMFAELTKINRERVTNNEAEIEIGIGINSGSSMVGLVGESGRLEAAVMSDTVNLSARLESLTKMYHCKVLFSEYALERVYDPDEDNYSMRKLDRVRVKGKNKPVTIYELLMVNNDPSAKLKIVNKEDYEKALLLYQQGDIVSALKLFETIVKNNPSDEAAKIFIARCNSFIVNNKEEKNLQINLPKNWDGVTTLQSK